MSQVVLGVERLMSDEKWSRFVKGRNVALLSHPAGVTSGFQSTLDCLVQRGANVVALLGPEHGFGGEAQDMESVDGFEKGPLGIPVYSLYGNALESLVPSDESLRGVEILVVDLVDVGSRYYTFVWTAVLCLRVCHRLGIQVLVLDRPNPLGGTAVEGAPQEDGFLSFVGLRKVSNRHGLTIGELLSMAAAEEDLGDVLTIVKMLGWNRMMAWEATGIPFVMPSPNMPTVETARVYPGMCLIEGTDISEGRGTTRPFELVGAPMIQSAQLAARLNAMKLEGVVFRSVTFKPQFQKHAQHICGGVQIHVTNPLVFHAYKTGVAMLVALNELMESGIPWRNSPYEFVTHCPAIDLLTGSECIRKGLESQATLEELETTWKKGEKSFTEMRKDFFLYR